MSDSSFTADQLARLGSRAVELLQHRRRCAFSPAPSEAIPGSPEKIEILAQRYAAGFPLWHPDDPPMPIGQGWETKDYVLPNGRVVYKRLIWLATGEPVLPGDGDEEE